MNKLFVFVVVLLGLSMNTGLAVCTDLPERLSSVPGIESVEVCYDTECGEYYRCFIRQPYDHEHPETGSFCQQFCLMHHSDSAAVVFVTTGGNLDSLYWSEAAVLLKANQVIIEPRFCGKSTPDSLVDWNILTMRQMAADVHAIIEILRTALYSGNYLVSTGSRQGGLVSLFHRRYYPEDVQQVILYNTPLCMDSPDNRVTRNQIKLGKPAKLFSGGGIKLGVGGGGFSFFPTGGELNYDIKDFQRYCFRHQDSLLPLFEEYCRERGLTFQRVGTSLRALQLTILEYRPAFFYKAVSKELIPYKDYDDPEFYFEHLVAVSDPVFFCDSSLHACEPMAWIALNETGNYRHFIRPYRKLLPENIEDHSYLYAADMPLETVVFQRKQMQEMRKWVQREAKDIVFIYGLLDIYSAARVNLKKNDSCTLLVHPGQGYDCRIEDFDWGTCNYLKDLIVSAYRERK